MQCPALNQNRRNGTASFFHLCFDNRAFRRVVRVRFQIQNFRLKQNRFYQLIQIDAFLCGNFNRQNVTPEAFHNNFVA